MEENRPIVGVITSRTCPTCGHHEIGYETESGEFHPLRPGDMVGVFPKAKSPGLADKGYGISQQQVGHKEEEPLESIPWVPDPLRCHGSLRRKYGILHPPHISREQMSPGMYERFFRLKLQKLIEAEQFIPISVILDRYFSAPHLAAGDSKEVADAMWEELEEIRRPVEKVEEWLQNRDTESLKKMILPVAMGELTGEPADDEELKQELDELSLEDFLEMI